MYEEKLIEYRPKPGAASGFRASPLTLLKLLQLPQIVLIEGIEPQLLPVDAECVEVCSRSNGYCVRLGGGRDCVSSYTPLLPGLTPAWASFMGRVESSDTSSPIIEGVVKLEKGEVSVTGVYRPRLYHLEPLAVRVFRPERLEYIAQVACIEWPSAALLALDGEPFTLFIEPGRISSDRPVGIVKARKCTRGLIARALNAFFYAGLRGPATIRGDLVILEYVYKGDVLEVVLWNPHTHPVYAEVYTPVYAVKKALLYTPVGSEELQDVYNRVALNVAAESVVRLQLKLRTLPPLLRPRRGAR